MTLDTILLAGVDESTPVCNCARCGLILVPRRVVLKIPKVYRNKHVVACRVLDRPYCRECAEIPPPFVPAPVPRSEEMP